MFDAVLPLPGGVLHSAPHTVAARLAAVAAAGGGFERSDHASLW